MREFRILRAYRRAEIVFLYVGDAVWRCFEILTPSGNRASVFGLRK